MSAVDMGEDTEAFVQGIAMSKIEEFNSPPELVAASLSAPALQAVTWPMLESACQACPKYKLSTRLSNQGYLRKAKIGTPTCSPSSVTGIFSQQ